MKPPFSLDHKDEDAGEAFSVGRLRKAATNLTQEQFAEAYQINYSTLRYWERKPDSLPSHARAYLHLIKVAPELVETLLSKRPEELEPLLPRIEAILNEIAD